MERALVSMKMELSSDGNGGRQRNEFSNSSSEYLKNINKILIEIYLDLKIL